MPKNCFSIEIGIRFLKCCVRRAGLSAGCILLDEWGLVQERAVQRSDCATPFVSRVPMGLPMKLLGREQQRDRSDRILFFGAWEVLGALLLGVPQENNRSTLVDAMRWHCRARRARWVE